MSISHEIGNHPWSKLIRVNFQRRSRPWFQTKDDCQQVTSVHAFELDIEDIWVCPFRYALLYLASNNFLHTLCTLFLPFHTEQMDHFDVLEAKFLVGSLANESFRAGGSGSMSTSIYDTAWVSMVSKDVDGVRHWLFPEAFQHIVDAQAKDGSWESYSSQVDGILNTMAALLAFVSHQNADNFSYSVLPPDIDARILKAQDSLRHQLQTWDVRSCVHVGFEILVPALLRMLEQYNIVCQFPGRTHLLQLNQEKLSRFQPEIFYENIQVTALHSLEAFIGTIDFNRIKHHLKDGSVMASPSSTAAYLMNTSTWDDESEIYLRNTIIEGAGKGNGSVPCAFPTTFFEFTWVRYIRYLI